MYNNYGTYRNPTFTQVFPDSTTFWAMYQDSDIYKTDNNLTINNRIDSKHAMILHGLLYAKYGNSVIASSDVERFKYGVWALIYQHGPSWVAKLDLQSKLRNMPDADLIQSDINIVNHAYNTATTITSVDTPILNVNEQTSSTNKRNKADAYARLYDFINNDVTGQFLDKFKPLFLKVVMPEKPLWFPEIEGGNC